MVSGLYAWNEDVVGAEIGATKGKATPMPATAQDRLIRIWASPQGAAKAALAGTTETWWLGANPGTLFADGLDKVGQTSVKWEAGKPVVTFPIPGVPGATGTATLDAKYMTEKVVVTNGSATTEFTYSGYKDWNNPLHKIEVFYAGKMVEKKNGAVVRDLTTDVTETGNVYVIAPVPASVKKAITVTAQLPKGVYAKPDAPVNKSAPTPRLAARSRTSRASGSTPTGSATTWGAAGADAVRRRRSPATGAPIRLKTSRSTRPRASSRWVFPCTSRSSGTRFKSSTCGPTSTTR